MATDEERQKRREYRARKRVRKWWDNWGYLWWAIGWSKQFAIDMTAAGLVCHDKWGRRIEFDKNGDRVQPVYRL